MKNPVAYQNKDIISKVFGESMRNKSFRAYGMDIPEIVEILPTNLPAVEANEMRLDNLFRLKDGTIVIVDYEAPTVTRIRSSISITLPGLQKGMD